MPGTLGDRIGSISAKPHRHEDRDPDVIVVGAGQAGLDIAARLGQLDIDTLVIDRHKRIGDK